MDDLFHLESLDGGQEQKRDKEILAAQERIRKLNEAIAEAPDKIIKLFTRKKRK